MSGRGGSASGRASPPFPTNGPKEPCARRSWERSAHFRAMPVYDPQFTVVDLETGDEHGPYDSWEDIALALAFARLSPDRVEVITDAPAIMGIAAWE